MSRGPAPRAGSRGVHAQDLTPEEQAGQEIIGQLQALMRSASMYAPGHASVEAQSTRMLVLLQKWFDELGVEQFPIIATQDYVYFGRDAVRPDERLVERVNWLREAFQRLEIAELRFRVGLTAGQISAFASSFVTAWNAETQMPEVNDGGPLEVLHSHTPPELEELLLHLKPARRGPLIQVYAEGLARARDWAGRAQRGHHAANVVAKRVVGQLVDAVAADSSGMLGLVTMRPRAGSFTNRRFDSAIVAVALARAAGLPDRTALELGMVTLVRPTPRHWPAWFVRKALAPHEASELAQGAKSAIERIVAFESCAPSGTHLPAAWYGERTEKHLATRIIQIAEAYVDLLQPGEASSPFSPEMALQMLRARSGSAFDPMLIELLTATLGYFPPGTLVQLNSGDVSVVVKAPPNGADLRRPAVRPVRVDARQTYHLHKPELASYRIVGTAQRAGLSCNPLFVFLQ